MGFQWLRYMLEVAVQMALLWLLYRREESSHQPTVNFDPATQEIVSKEFVKQADNNHALLLSRSHRLRHKTEECDKARKKLQATIQELDDLKAFNVSLDINEAEIVKLWKVLQLIIRIMSTAHFIWDNRPGALKQKHEALLSTVNPQHRHLFAAQAKTDILLQYLLWKYLEATLLSHSLEIWGKDVREAFNLFESIMDQNHYRIWRSQTSRLLQHEPRIASRVKPSTKKKWASSFMDCIPTETFRDWTHARQFLGCVELMFDKATRLVALVNQSRAEYFVRRAVEAECIVTVVVATTPAEAMMVPGHDNNKNNKNNDDDDDGNDKNGIENNCVVDRSFLRFTYSPALMKTSGSRDASYPRSVVLAEPQTYRLGRALRCFGDEGGDGGNFLKEWVRRRLYGG